MASAIDPTKPEHGAATTPTVRANFAAAKEEIEALQAGGAWLTGDIRQSAEPLSEPAWLLCDGRAVSQTTYADLYAKTGQNPSWGVCETRQNTQYIALNSTPTCIETDASDTYMAFTLDLTPYLALGKITDDDFQPLTDPTTMPDSSAMHASFTDDGIYLAIATTATPFVYIYKRSGDTFTKLSDPATLPTASASAVAFSPDGTYLAVGHSASPYVTIYKRSGDTFTKLSDPATLPIAAVLSLEFSADGNYLALGVDDEPYIVIYQRSGDTFTKMDDPATTPVASGLWVSFSPDSTYLAVGQLIDDYLLYYKLVAGEWIKQPIPNGDTPETKYIVQWSTDGKYLLARVDAYPFIRLYEFKDGKISLNGTTTYPVNSFTPASVTQAFFSRGGKYLFSSLFEPLYWDATKGNNANQATEFCTPVIKGFPASYIKT